jgi:hypothetical protein
METVARSKADNNPLRQPTSRMGSQHVHHTRARSDWAGQEHRMVGRHRQLVLVVRSREGRCGNYRQSDHAVWRPASHGTMVCLRGSRVCCGGRVVDVACEIDVICCSILRLVVNGICVAENCPRFVTSNQHPLKARVLEAARPSAELPWLPTARPFLRYLAEDLHQCRQLNTSSLSL